MSFAVGGHAPARSRSRSASRGTSRPSTDEIAAATARSRTGWPPAPATRSSTCRVAGDAVEVEVAGPRTRRTRRPRSRCSTRPSGGRSARPDRHAVRVFAGSPYPAARRRPVTPDPVRASADRLPPPRPRRERGLGLGAGGAAGGVGPAPDRGPRPGALPARVRRGPPRGPDWLGFRAGPGSGPPERRRRAVRGCAGTAARRTASSTAATARGRPSSDWADDARSPWHGPGCPGGCRERGRRTDDAAGRARRWLGALDGPLVGPCSDEVAAGAAIRRSATATATGPTASRSSWTTCARASTSSSAAGTCSTRQPTQIRLGRLLGRATPPTFAHHPLIRRPDGAKLSKADGATGVRDLRAAGRTAADLIGEAAAPSAWSMIARPIHAADVAATRSAARSASLAVLDLPGVVEGVPGDPARGVPRRPLAAGERRTVRRLAQDARASPRASRRPRRGRSGRAASPGGPSRGRRTSRRR